MSETALADKVDRDPELSGSEKETTITMCGDDKRFKMYSAKPTVVKSLLRHDHFELEWARVLDDERSEYYESRDALREVEGKIVAVEGTLPVGVLTVKSKPRANNHQSSIVSWESIDPSVFGDGDDE